MKLLAAALTVQLILSQAEALDLMALPVALLGIYAYRRRWALGLLLALPLLWLPQTLSGEPPALPLLITLLSYLALAAQRLRPTESPVEWSQARPPRLEPLPWLAGLLVLAGSLGVLAWPPIQEALSWGFPAQRSNAAIFLILSSALLGLWAVWQMAYRRPRQGSWLRLSLLSLLGLLFFLGGGALC